MSTVLTSFTSVKLLQVSLIHTLPNPYLYPHSALQLKKNALA